MSFRQMVRIEPGKPVKVSFVTAIAETREDAIEIAAKYSSAHVIKDEISMAITRSRVEARYLSLVTEEIELFQNLISHILFIDPHHRKKQDCIKNNKRVSLLCGLMVYRETYPLCLLCWIKQRILILCRRY